MSAADGLYKRRRSAFSFDPLNEPGLTVLAWYRAIDRVLGSNGHVLSVPSRVTSRPDALIRSSLTGGSWNIVGPYYLDSDPVMGGRPSIVQPYSTTEDMWLLSQNTFPSSGQFTVVFIGAQDSGTANAYQVMWAMQNQQFLGSYPGTRTDILYCNNGTQTELGLISKGIGAFCSVLTGGAGASNYMALNDPTPDITTDMGSLGFGGSKLVVGVDNATASRAKQLCGRWSEILVIDGILSVSKLKRLMSWSQQLHKHNVGFDPPGTLYRAQDYWATNSRHSADGYLFPFYNNVESMTAESGELRALMAYDSNDEDIHRGSAQMSIAQGTTGVTWSSARAGNGRHEIVTPYADVFTLLGHGTTGTAAVPRRNEVFTAMGGGKAPHVFWRDDQSMPFVELPFDPSITLASFSPSGKIDVGGSRDLSAYPLHGYIRELLTLRDGALPNDVRLPTYSPGVMAFYGSELTWAVWSSWPARAIQRNLAAGRYTYPRPRQVDPAGFANVTWTTLGSTRFAADLAPLLVSGGSNYVFFDLWVNDFYYESKTEAQTLTAMLATCNALKSSYGGSPYNLKIAVSTICPTQAGTYATMISNFNTSLRAVSSPPWDILIDMATVSPFNFTTVWTYYPDGYTQIAMGAVAGTALAPWFST
jgi:hypothetical protein